MQNNMLTSREGSRLLMSKAPISSSVLFGIRGFFVSKDLKHLHRFDGTWSLTLALCKKQQRFDNILPRSTPAAYNETLRRSSEV